MQNDNHGHTVSRRSLLKGLGLLGGGVAGTAVLSSLPAERAQAAVRAAAQGSVPSAAGPPVVATTFLLEVEQIGFGRFQQCLNLGSESEILEDKIVDGGAELVRKVPGRLRWLDPILRRGMTDNLNVWDWHRLVTDGNMQQARKNCTIIAQDDLGTTVAQWNLLNAWPRETRGKLGRTGADPYQSQMLEELVLVAESIERVAVASADRDAGAAAIQAGDPSSGYFHELEVEGVSYGFFVEVRNVGWDVEVVEHQVMGPGGSQVLRKVPGRTRCRDVTLTRPISGDLPAWSWRRLIEDGNSVEARKDCAVVAHNEEGAETARLEIFYAWPQKLATAIGEDGALNESLTLTFESFLRVS